ncbi:ABC transporter substrate-binding protein [Conexibacter woesei]|uniref:Extracellular solute-binding protein family 5 n=1 Tax=Conexibacter woesei (strain DSM 14684 / CCUG 47730 / CIP 108061 / JCM 11494 / NBRC 100937 / ID131577) TaxID=469383 RepID=D3FCD4_CONWI|nr:ABC transporter substrate-binding protein [Conexibacter woesei]ADB53429.1 extracellular solute-binding protein family 5 [Conexibacter woesei DSM 14684]
MKHLTRREFSETGIRYGAAAGLLGGGLATVLAGCGGDSSSDGSTSAGTTPADGSGGGSGGTIRIGNAEPPTSAQWDPHAAFGLADYQTWSLVYDTLLAYDSAGELVGQLAKSWKRLSPTRLRIVIHRDVHFSDGSPLGAEDVKASIERISAPQSELALASKLPEGAKVEVRGEHELDIVTPEPFGPLEGALVVVSIVSRRDAARPEAFKRRPLGSGPYTFVEYRNNSIRLKANPRYWRGKPGSDGVVLSYVQDPSARMNALLTGQIDIYTRADSIVLDEVRGNDDFYVNDTSPASNFFYIPQFDTALRDVRVRQAIAYAIPRQQIAESIMRICPPALSSLPAASKGFRPMEPRFDLDLERARSLLKEAGHDGGLSITLASASVFAHQEQVDQLVKASLEQVGITVDIKKLESGTFRSNFSQYALSMNALDTPGDPNFIFSFFRPSIAREVLKWDSADFMPLVEAQRRTIGARRQATIDAAARYLWENQILVYLTDDIWYTVVNRRVSGYERSTVEGEPLLWRAKAA